MVRLQRLAIALIAVLLSFGFAAYEIEQLRLGIASPAVVEGSRYTIECVGRDSTTGSRLYRVTDIKLQRKWLVVNDAFILLKE